MTGEEILDAMEHIDPDLIEAADVPVQKRRKPYWVAAVAALLVIAFSISIFSPAQALVAKPKYPNMAVYADPFDNPSANEKWMKSVNELHNQPEGFADNLQPFFTHSMQTFLSGGNNSNKVYSPVNLYMALAMLAECTGGNTRQQILDLLDAESVEGVREQAHQVWQSLYWDDGLTTSVLANSVWLDNNFLYNKSTANTLANQYYASVYRGDLGTEEMNKQLVKWLNEQTGNLLTDQTNNIEMTPETVFALCSTIFFQAKWETPFDPSRTKDGIFHSPDGDTQASYMKSTLMSYYFQGENFGMIRMPLSLKSGFSMWFILPNQESSVQDVIKNGTCFDMAQNPWDSESREVAKIILSMPKFDISTQTNLNDGLKALGITDAFDASVADFSPITSTNLYLQKADQAARVTINEDGVTGASYTEFEMLNGGIPELIVDFTLDRPFIFVITSSDGLPLFTGVVNEP